MESHPSSIENDCTQPPPLPDSCPVSTLLDVRLTEMSDEELEKWVTELRSVRESPQIMRALLVAGTAKKKSAEKKKPNLALLGL